MTVLDKARLFIVKQRIRELENSIDYWPHSEKLKERMDEVEDLKEELKLLEKK